MDLRPSEECHLEDLEWVNKIFIWREASKSLNPLTALQCNLKQISSDWSHVYPTCKDNMLLLARYNYHKKILNATQIIHSQTHTQTEDCQYDREIHMLSLSRSTNVRETAGHFTLWISLSLRPKTRNQTAQHWSQLEFRLTNHCSSSSLTSSAARRWCCHISLFIFELAKK